ncbi:hypothetical protein [Amycolatopsis sp. PS_44_ISF1]|uniref:hypothetical protein n=1 Tax=Amycolatopsis sp. PS_44_ISF1 TaxID=2974917 RepID=UPI0028DDA622|nr:hypothetical protein [Amycolatopsis sp. PS_44_ISF1]MDT8909310.1 hypothetical protein [Amycolatopsis sp. PS_44_ISF1]
MRTARIAVVVLFTAGLLAYSAWLLEFVVDTGLSPVDRPAEDLLGANPVFRIARGLAGLAFVLSGPPLMRLAPVHWTSRLSAVAVAVFGFLMLADAAEPGLTAVELAANLVFVAGALSLVLWWPPRWREWAIAGLALVLTTWALVLVAGTLGPGHAQGLLTRVQLAVRTVLLGVGAAYVVVTPVHRRS